jgi:hypothetical protein
VPPDLHPSANALDPTTKPSEPKTSPVATTLKSFRLVNL